jgi:hypothetical protein
LVLGVKAQIHPKSHIKSLEFTNMRKTITFSLIAGAALLVSACNKSEAPVADNAAAPEVNAVDAMEGTTNDAMTNTDATATGAESNMTADNAVAGNAVEAAANATDEAANAAGNAVSNAK